MVDVLLNIVQRTEMNAEQSMYVLEGIAQILFDYEALSHRVVHRLAQLLEKISRYDILGMAKMNYAILQSAISILENLSVRARTLRLQGKVGDENSIAIENELQKFSDVTIKAGLEYSSELIVQQENLAYVQEKNLLPNAVLYGVRKPLDNLQGVTITVPIFQDLSVLFPKTLSLTGYRDTNLLDVQISYRRDVVYFNASVLKIVTGVSAVLRK